MSDEAVAVKPRQKKLDLVATIGWVLVCGGVIWLFVTLVRGRQGDQVMLLSLGKHSAAGILGAILGQVPLWAFVAGLLIGVVARLRSKSKESLQLIVAGAAFAVLSVLRGLLP
jgi:hypothetical protein